MRPEQVHLLGHAEATPAHTHTRGHLVYPARGVLAVATSEGSWIAPPNRVIWTPGGFEHQHRAYGATDMRVIFMVPSLAALLPPRPAVMTTTPLAREALLALTAPGPRSAAARARLRRVAIDDLSAAPEHPLYLPEPRDDRLLAVTRLVEQDVAAPDTLARLGRRVGASERTLSRLFQAETGMSFPRWRAQLRIHRALVLLAEGRTVIDTATACGWSNPSSFIDTFTALVGQTPGRYRRALIGGR